MEDAFGRCRKTEDCVKSLCNFVCIFYSSATRILAEPKPIRYRLRQNAASQPHRHFLGLIFKLCGTSLRYRLFHLFAFDEFTKRFHFLAEPRNIEHCVSCVEKHRFTLARDVSKLEIGFKLTFDNVREYRIRAIEFPFLIFPELSRYSRLKYTYRLYSR